MLEKIPFWEWDSRKANWEKGFNHLKQYIKKYNQICPKSYVTDDGFKLGSWVGTQRLTYSQNKISKDRVILLEKLPNWQWVISSNK